MSVCRKRKSEIEDDLRKNPPDPRYTFVPPLNKMKSDVWKNFHLVKFEETLENFARCNICKEILAYSAKSGTGSLLRHTCSRQDFKGSSTSRTHLTVESFASKKLPERVKLEMQKQQVGFITKDLRPLNITEGEGFKKFAQALINIGAQYGNQNIDDVLVSRQTLTRTILPAEYDTLKSQLENILSQNNLAFTTYIWTDEYNQRSFLTLTTHYINEKFDLKSNVVGTREFPLGEKSALNIHEFVIEMLANFKIEDKLKSGVIVTDSGTNIVAAFRNYIRISCACHNLNLVMEEILEEKKIPELEELIDASKTLVSYFQHSELNSKLTKSLQQHVNTRWDSLYMMFSSIFDMYQEIQQILIERKELPRIAGINHNLLERLLEFLTLFKDCSEKLSSDVVPTIHEYSLWFEKLWKHCARNPADSEVITELKSGALTSLKEKFQPSTIHDVALFLNPSYKALKFLSEEQRLHIKESVKAMLILDQREEDRITASTDTTTRNVVAPSISGYSGSDRGDIFEEFKDQYGAGDADNDFEKIDIELEIYLKKHVGQCDVLKFWRDALDLPLLRNLSRQILNIPASSAPSERVFSISGRILEERRTRLLGENIDQILFLNKNYDFLGTNEK